MKSNRAFTWTFGVTILLSAFLVFQVQPIISKAILPWFGGTPAVWTTCMLFFQLFLFAGYCYAHLLSKLTIKRQAAIHLPLLFLSLALLPIIPGGDWKPDNVASPTSDILLLLLVHVGLPYFLLSSTGPLLQSWFSRASDQSPYRLYALSNIGSLGALLSYPVLFEPAFGTARQGQLWSIGFGLFAVCCVIAVMMAWKRVKSFVKQSPTETMSMPKSQKSASGTASGKPSHPYGLWIGLPALASIILLASTNHICQDVAVIPFLWVAPLSLYLLTFILCFDGEGWYRPRIYSGVALVSIVVINFFNMFVVINNIVLEVGVYLTAMFTVCMICHGELVKRKPRPEYLTKFYLMISAGGALGGIAVALVCPRIFHNYFEMNAALVVSFMLALLVFVSSNRQLLKKSSIPMQLTTGTFAFLTLLLVVHTQASALAEYRVSHTRNFYGVTSVAELGQANDEHHGIGLVHGRVLHGFQFLAPDKRRKPTAYYAHGSGVELTMQQMRLQGNLRVGVVGLGIGTLAAYAREGDYFRFYEINPAVIDVAKEHFTFVNDCPAELDIVEGDGRLRLEAEPAQNYDVLVIDAFSGDSIPTHLLTREVFKTYQRHLKPDGVLVINVSNQHIELRGVVTRLVSETEWESLYIEAAPGEFAEVTGSQWMIATNNTRFLSDEGIQQAVENSPATFGPAPLWTDECSNLFQLLK